MNQKNLGWLYDVILVGLPILGLSPLLTLQALSLWSRPSLQFSPVVVLVFAAIFFFSRKNTTSNVIRRRFGIAAALMASLFAIYSAWIFSPYLAHFSILLYLLAWGLIRLSSDSIGRVLGWSVLGLLTLPLPWNLDTILEAWANSIVAASTSGILDALQVYHLLQPPFLAVEQRTINYVDYLGSAFSFRAIIAFSIFLVLIRNHAFVVGLFSSGMAIVCTCFGKLVLLSTTVLLLSNSYEWNVGWIWSLLPWGIVAVVMVLVMTFESFWGAILEPIVTANEIVRIEQNPTANFYNRIVAWPRPIAKRRSRNVDTVNPDPKAIESPGAAPSKTMIGLTAFVGVLVIPLGIAIQKHDLLFNTNQQLEISQERQPNAQTIPATLFPRLRLSQYQTNSADVSSRGGTVHLWNFSGIDSDSQIRVVYPVEGWTAQLGIDETSNGQTIDKKLFDMDNNWPYSESTYSAKNGKQICLFRSQLMVDGSPYKPTVEDLQKKPVVTEPSRWLQSILLNYLTTQFVNKPPASILIELQYETSQALTQSELDSLRQIYSVIRDSLSKKLKGEWPSSTKEDQ